jgi:hypothetical protein
MDWVSAAIKSSVDMAPNPPPPLPPTAPKLTPMPPIHEGAASPKPKACTVCHDTTTKNPQIETAATIANLTAKELFNVDIFNIFRFKITVTAPRTARGAAKIC